MTTRLLGPVILFLLAALPAFAGPGLDLADPESVARVEGGEVPEANAAWWGFDAADATAAIQGAIDSGAKRVVVPYVAKPWIVTPIKLRSDLELVFEPGVVVLAKEGAFKGKGDSLFTAGDAQDITIRGYGATLRMRKADYQSEAYEKAEWRMCLAFRGCRRVTVEGLRLESSGGDGIYIGATGALPYCEDVTIRDVVCHDHHRQGVSVIGAVNLLIENCAFTGTGGTAPRAGIDLEPNGADEKLTNCVIRNCVMADNEGPGILIYLRPLDKTTEPVSILFENCHVRSGKSTGISVAAIKDDGPGGTVTFRNCVIENTTGNGLNVSDKAPASALVEFINCKWGAVDPGAGAVMLLHTRRPEVAQSVGGVRFENCHVYDTEDRPALAVDDKKAGAPTADITGEIHVMNPAGVHVDLGKTPENVAVIVKELGK